jgi:uncharacterized OB-fold protein
VVHPETETHWRGLARGHLLLQRCRACRALRFPLAPVCHACLSAEADWVPAPTEGTVSAAVTVHRATGDQRWAEQVPFVVAQVDMPEGIRLPGRIVDADPATPPKRGTRVSAAFLDAGGGVGVLCFTITDRKEPE